jgi:hypothetical protein
MDMGVDNRGTTMTRKTPWRVVKLMMEELGATFLINPPTFTPYDTGLGKYVAQRRCQKALDPGDKEYEFPEQERTTRVTIVWDHFHPPRSFPRTTLRSTLGSGHVYDDDVAHVWGVPRDLGRPPLESEIAAYRERTLAAIEAAECPHVMLLGKAAIALWRPDLKPMQVTGGTFLWGNKWVYPTIHPSAIAMDGQNLQIWREGMRGLARGIFDGEVQYGYTCIKCGDAVDAYDRNAVPYCREHFNMSNADSQEKKMKKASNKSKQIGMDL